MKRVLRLLLKLVLLLLGLAALLGLTILGLAVAGLYLAGDVRSAEPVRLDRVELMAREDGTFLVDDLPTLGTRPGPVALRFLSQVQPVLTDPSGRFGLGLSWATQVLSYEHPLGSGLGAELGLQTRLGLPVGAGLGASWSRGPARVGLGVNLVSGATWARPRWTGWRVLPGMELALRLGHGEDD